ncbi:MAG: tRNA (adenosine(37)-N6)-dimethylallyltransferase MiaA [Candidatus Kerfeldbacteria bacterium CG08_land_8_20_14_0_20_42_7]|uniref:tRNA dimethylallyltransferase n=1 Tax=Candidatus Kerfeldbacteria bacterium CG08_land_8_20_14_0_20_42_7 TaxID=2014245 RepID=A0A2H0YRI8_9BACT|nr:MAG: tRNA (adenosine(37)-N6)-dimethylallyltransferase MiaA [Candidatus Kerfeldbacteria bacterium CG08_land_8_20_14_0_20_42_7]
MLSSIKKQRIIAIVGTNASGKSSLAISLARHAKGEVISADSRQVYKGLDIGSGKISKTEQRMVTHHLLDVISPKTTYAVSHFIADATTSIRQITQRKHIPIVCGGTGFWIDTLLFGKELPTVQPNKALRAKLEKQRTQTLFAKLQKKDPTRAKSIDRNNRRRIIRALEIISATKKPVQPIKTSLPYSILWIGVTHTTDSIKKRIHKRLMLRMRQGMVTEVRRLHASGISWKRLFEFGLEYRYISLYLQKKVSKKDMLKELEKEIYRYAKRQKTWFQRNKDIHWITSYREAEKLVKIFLK